MWRAWIGFNFSHSLGVLLVAGLALWAGFRFNTLPVGIIIMPALTLIGASIWFSPCSTGFVLPQSALRLVLYISPFAAQALHGAVEVCQHSSGW